TRWGMGRVTLIGDAAHAMTPNLGQGANQALQDAVALAAAIAEAAAGEIEPALRAYEPVRLPRANAVGSASRQAGGGVPVPSPPPCRVRDALLATRVARAMQLNQLRRFAARDAP